MAKSTLVNTTPIFSNRKTFTNQLFCQAVRSHSRRCIPATCDHW